MRQILLILAGKAATTTFKSVTLGSTCEDSMQAIVNIFKFALTVIQWLVPVLLILWGTIDLVKSVVAGKEEDIKKNQKTLVRRVISAVIVFLLPLAVSILMGLIGTEGWRTCWKEAEATINLNEIDGD